jgi:hypothetical protein
LVAGRESVTDGLKEYLQAGGQPQSFSGFSFRPLKIRRYI